jgi:hypothetical protein
MFIILGITGIAVGAGFAASARRFPEREPILERFGGGLFFGGVALIAFAFPAL